MFLDYALYLLSNTNPYGLLIGYFVLLALGVYLLEWSK